MLTSPVRHFLSGLTIASAALPVLLVGCRPGGGDAVIGTEEAVLTHAPAVPPPISRSHPTRVIVNLETQELVRTVTGNVAPRRWGLAFVRSA